MAASTTAAIAAGMRTRRQTARGSSRFQFSIGPSTTSASKTAAKGANAQA